MTIVLSQTSSSDVHDFGKQIFADQLRRQTPTFEEMAQYIVASVAQTFLTPQGKPNFALSRIFRLCTYPELPPDVTSRVNPDQADHWMVLAGSMGDDPSWRDRHLRDQFQVVPPQEHGMFAEAFNQIELAPVKKPGSQDAIPVSSQDQPVFEAGSLMMTRYVLIEDVVGHPYITAQDEFVKPYGLRSMVGFGGRFLSGSMYLMVNFSRTPIDRQQAQVFNELLPYVSSMLARADQAGALWN